MSALLKILAFLALSGLPASRARSGVGEVVARASSCATGVHIIVARASGEAPGEGIIGSVASSVVKQIAGSDSEAVPYPATLDSYPQSEGYGTGNMTQLLKAYVNRCSSSKIVLMGYSQGAQVTLDTLCGTTDGSEFTSTPPLSSPYSKNVVAVIAMGDPSHVPGKTWDVGTSTKQGSMLKKLALAASLYTSSALGAPAGSAVVPTVKGTPQNLGVAMDSYLNRDSCGSARFNDRAFWTCRDTQNFNSDGSVQVSPLYSSSASWNNFSSDGKPTVYPANVFEGQGGLPLYGVNNDNEFYTILSEDCGDNTAGSCSDGTRYAIWPDSPPMVVSSSAQQVVGYTWIRRSHIRGDLSTVESDPPTTLYKVTYTAGGADDSLPQVSVVDAAFWAVNETAYGNYGNVVQDGTAYLWGKPSNGHVCLAKVPAGSVEDKSQYQYWVNGAWTTTMPSIDDDGANIANAGAGGQGTFYYSDAWQSYVWIGQGGFSVAADFFITTAPAPTGPWASPTQFYSGVNGNYSLGAYSLQAHPALIEPGANEIYITYTKNDLIDNVNVYTTPLIYVQWE